MLRFADLRDKALYDIYIKETGMRNGRIPVSRLPENRYRLTAVTFEGLESVMKFTSESNQSRFEVTSSQS